MQPEKIVSTYGLLRQQVLFQPKRQVSIHGFGSGTYARYVSTRTAEEKNSARSEAAVSELFRIVRSAARRLTCSEGQLQAQLHFARRDGVGRNLTGRRVPAQGCG